MKKSEEYRYKRIGLIVFMCFYLLPIFFSDGFLVKFIFVIMFFLCLFLCIGCSALYKDALRYEKEQENAEVRKQLEIEHKYKPIVTQTTRSEPVTVALPYNPTTSNPEPKERVKSEAVAVSTHTSSLDFEPKAHIKSESTATLPYSPTLNVEPKECLERVKPTAFFYIENRLITDSFVAFDLETTGLDSTREEIIEIGAVKYVDGIRVSEFNELIKPHKSIPTEATNINNITNEMVKDKPYIEEILPKFLEFIEEMPLIAHNAKFDISFLYSEIQFSGRERPCNKIADTLQISRDVFRGFPNYKLGTVAEQLGIIQKSAHRAFGDADVVAHIYMAYLKTLKDEREEEEKRILTSLDRLSDFEKECFVVMSDILKGNGKSYTRVMLTWRKTQTYFCIKYKWDLVKIRKMKSKIYVLLEEDDLFPCSSQKDKGVSFYGMVVDSGLTLEDSTQREKGKRIIIESPSDLIKLTKAILFKVEAANFRYDEFYADSINLRTMSYQKL